MTPITCSTILSGTHALLHEFLSDYFDGGTHAVAGYSGTWPAASLSFDLSAVAQPLGGAGITTLVSLRNNYRYPTTEGTYAWTDADLTFFVRAQVDAATPGQGVALARTVTERLLALLNDRAATQPLARNGLLRLDPDGVAVVPTTDWALRTVRASAELHYTIPETL